MVTMLILYVYLPFLIIFCAVLKCGQITFFQFSLMTMISIAAFYLLYQIYRKMAYYLIIRTSIIHINIRQYRFINIIIKILYTIH